MSSTPESTSAMDETVRESIIKDPEQLLEDQDIMRALVAANERAMGSNIVDLRSIAMERLEQRLDRLEDTHRNVIAAAYENLAGTNQIHRAVLRLLDAMTFEAFLDALGQDVADILRVDAVTLVLETEETGDDPALERFAGLLTLAEPGYVDAYITRGRPLPARQVALRPVEPETADLYGEKAGTIMSEACLKLDLGDGRLPGMLVLGAEESQQFTPQQGTDLLAFLAGVFERSMRRWLS